MYQKLILKGCEMADLREIKMWCVHLTDTGCPRIKCFFLVLYYGHIFSNFWAFFGNFPEKYVTHLCFWQKNRIFFGFKCLQSRCNQCANFSKIGHFLKKNLKMTINPTKLVPIQKLLLFFTYREWKNHLAHVFFRFVTILLFYQ